MERKGYKNLIAFQKADELVLKTYDLTRSFPKEELFGLVSQIRRAVISVPANIVEGYRRGEEKEKIRFYNIAQGSLVEVEYFLELSKKLGYINEGEFENAFLLKDDIGKLLHGLIKVIKKDLVSESRSQ